MEFCFLLFLLSMCYIHKIVAKYAVVVTLAFPEEESRKQERESPPSINNSPYYCARHGYDYIVAKMVYPVLGPEVNNQCTFPVASYAIAKHALHNYEWLYLKQNDLIFTNMDIKLEDITRHVPADKHLVIAPAWPHYNNDIAFMIRNSPEVKI